MIGRYKTHDGCVYEVFMCVHGKPAKSTMMGKRIYSPVVPHECEPFPLVTGQIERVIRFKLWTKIE